MSLLTDLTAAIRDGSIEVVDLTAPLNDTTPVIRLPEPFGNRATFSLQQISRYDDRGPAWYWNEISHPCLSERFRSRHDCGYRRGLRHWLRQGASQ